MTSLLQIEDKYSFKKSRARIMRQTNDVPTIRMFSVALALGTIFVAAVPIADTAEATEWEGRDKEFHLIAGIVTGSSVTAYTKSPTKGVLVGVTVGVLKEIADHESGTDTTSAKDLAVTALGAIAGSYVTGLIITPGAVSYRWKW